VVKYHVAELGGRGNVEKEILTLQSAEQKGEVETLKCFIFDLDNAPTSLTSSRLVKVLQWKRRCLENYLIDDKIIYDMLNDRELSRDHIENRGEVHNIFKEIAVSQLRETVAIGVYNTFAFENLGLRPKEIAGKTYPEMADVLFSRVEVLKTQIGGIGGLTDTDWKQAFISKCEAAQVEWLFGRRSG
jgi:hypothetical protein